MFTQCSKCETVYRLSAEVLRAAGGQVRCGRCGDVFNALAQLAETANGFKAGESSLDLETRADNILHSIDAVPPVETQASAGPEIAHLSILDFGENEAAGEESLEFTLPPRDLDRVFIETSPSVLKLLVPASATGAAGSPVRGPTPPAPTPPAPALIALPPAPAPVALPPAPAPVALPPAAADPVPPSAAAAVADGAAHAAAATRRPGLEVSEHVRREMLASYTHAELPQINVPRRRPPFAVWLAGAIVLAVLLAVQVIRDNREWLAVHAPLLAGGSLSPANLAAYQLRQWGVTGDPAAKGTLRVRASIMNTAAQMEPYPLLRVTLANRFGTRIGQREFTPADYLGKATPRMLSPGERADATLDILDPGKDAEGFEIDVCLRDAQGKTRCAGDAAARTP